jgi:comEA protein
MFSLSPPEKKVLIIIAFIIFIGITIRYFNLEVKNIDNNFQSAAKQFQAININQADSNTLQKISGIGPVLSSQIIKHRETRGPFQTIDDLKKVKGIGQKKAKIIAEYIKF